MADSIIVKAKVKELAGSFNVAGDFLDAFDEEVKKLLSKALKRAEANSRRTVMAKDI